MNDIDYFWNKKAIYPLDPYINKCLTTLLVEFCKKDICKKCQSWSLIDAIDDVYVGCTDHRHSEYKFVTECEGFDPYPEEAIKDE